MRCTLGVDVGTSSTKGVLVSADGQIVASATRAHDVDRPRSGWVEMDARIWWDEFVSIARELITGTPDAEIAAVGVSGMGPCVLLADADEEPVRPAILYGVDTRSGAQIARMNDELGVDEIIRVGGSTLTSQAGGAKIAWIDDEEPDAWAKAERFFMPASWLARRLTGAYVLDHQSASQTSPLYDIENETWHEPWWQRYAGTIEQPRLTWAGDIAGAVADEAAELTGIPAGTPVITGTIDAWTEAVSVGAHEIGDLMLMYGTTMFLVATGEETLRTPSMWTTAGAFPGTRNLAGGLSTSGALTAWLKDLTGADYPALLADAETRIRMPGESSPVSPSSTPAATCIGQRSRPRRSACGTMSRPCALRAPTSVASSPSAVERRDAYGSRSSRTSPASSRRFRPRRSVPVTGPHSSQHPPSPERTTSPSSPTGTRSPRPSPRTTTCATSTTSCSTATCVCTRPRRTSCTNSPPNSAAPDPPHRRNHDLHPSHAHRAPGIRTEDRLPDHLG
jgi:hypothetical protein